MSNGTGAVIRNAYLPYIRAFLNRPQSVALRFNNTAASVRGTIYLAQADFNRFQGDVSLRSEQARTFNNLVHERDNRRSALRFRLRPAQIPRSTSW